MVRRIPASAVERYDGLSLDGEEILPLGRSASEIAAHDDVLSEIEIVHAVPDGDNVFVPG